MLSLFGARSQLKGKSVFRLHIWRKILQPGYNSTCTDQNMPEKKTETNKVKRASEHLFLVFHFCQFPDWSEAVRNAKQKSNTWNSGWDTNSTLRYCQRYKISTVVWLVEYYKYWAHSQQLVSTTSYGSKKFEWSLRLTILCRTYRKGPGGSLYPL